jgi:hypothetical protein
MNELYTTLDLSNKQDFEKLEKYFGGMDILSKKFPKIHKMLLDSKNFHSNKKQNESKINEEYGLRDIASVSIGQIPVYPGNNSDEVYLSTFELSSECSFINETTEIQIESSIMDKETQEIFCSETFFKSDSNSDYESISINPSNLQLDKLYDFIGASKFIQYCKDEHNSDIINKVIISKTELFSIYTNDTVVSQIYVNAPLPVNPTMTSTKIIYNYDGSQRNESDATKTYDVKVCDLEGIPYVGTKCPFSVDILLSDPLYYDEDCPVNIDNQFSIELINREAGGAVSFSNPEGIVTLVDSEDPGAMTLEISDEVWSSCFELSKLSISGLFDFKAIFYIQYRKGGHDEISNARVIVGSNNIVQSVSSKLIPPITIVWGCLGKDSLLQTRYGNKRVDKILINEEILGEDKEYVKVTDIIEGYEVSIVNIGVKGIGDILQLTSTHPIKTKRGVIPACDLNAADLVMQKNGTYVEISYIELVPYNNKVYNIKTDKGTFISVNDIMVANGNNSFAKPYNKKIKQSMNSKLSNELLKWKIYKQENLKEHYNEKFYI